ncbi:DUF6390 family protein [Nocardia puris]|uniref:Uncharacterized protein n=1 Tax=Nocardia puris TaxID=208602 RepID=A0A366DHA8_9NOCA|nr:DUF6390 family protein [Nocardia puris]RBO89477.1 hypothetical protein DFR74_107155 [Nocardia puris]
MNTKIEARDGVDMFARYAYAPNHLGFCGPADTTALRDGDAERVRVLARGFSGAWPYLCVLARLTGIADPLDKRLVESYWLGGGVGAELDRGEFLTALLDLIGPVAGSYWSHLGPELVAEAAADHAFHVFAVYPWSRLLTTRAPEKPREILDNCRITPAEVVAREGSTLTVAFRPLRWDGAELTLADEVSAEVPVTIDGYAALPDTAPGDLVALHWGHLCGRLTRAQADRLVGETEDRLRVTSTRLAVGRARA